MSERQNKGEEVWERERERCRDEEGVPYFDRNFEKRKVGRILSAGHVRTSGVYGQSSNFCCMEIES